MASPTPQSVDLYAIQDLAVRRAICALRLEMGNTIQRQQQQIEALLELLIDKHAFSLGEFKIYLQKVQQRSERTQRLEQALSTAPQRPTIANAPIDEDEDEPRRKVYHL